MPRATTAWVDITQDHESQRWSCELTVIAKAVAEKWTALVARLEAGKK